VKIPLHYIGLPVCCVALRTILRCASLRHVALWYVFLDCGHRCVAAYCVALQYFFALRYLLLEIGRRHFTQFHIPCITNVFCYSMEKLAIMEEVSEKVA